jgi:hypothetical protein
VAKKPKRGNQVAWSGPSVAKHIGRDWKTMSTEERGLLGDAVRFCYNQHNRVVTGHDVARMAAVVKVQEQRETYRARLAKLRATVRRQADRWRNRMTV